MNDQQPLVYVIILNYNGKKYLQACISSITLQTYSNYKIIVCDNASNDDSVEYVTKNFPEVIVLRAEENLGFAEGNNLAIKFALNHKSNYVFLLNNDTTVEPNLLDKLVTTAEVDNEIGIVGPAIFDYYSKDVLQEAGMTIDRFGFPISIKSGFDNKEKPAEPFFVSGCALLIKAEVLNAIGFFDKEYFMFAEDLDLCWRAQLAGYKVAVNLNAKIYHASGGSISGGVIKNSKYATNVKRVFLREKNTLRTLLKNYNFTNLMKIIPSYVELLTFESILWLFLLKPQVSVSDLKALYYNLKLFPDTMRQRYCVQNLRKTSDCEINKKMTNGYGKIVIFTKVGVPGVHNTK